MQTVHMGVRPTSDYVMDIADSEEHASQREIYTQNIKITTRLFGQAGPSNVNVSPTPVEVTEIR